MKVVILAGGYGTRLTEETRIIPKPMVEIGEMPIIWHIMKHYSFYGFNEFIICCGYKQDVIKKWFADYYLTHSDVTFDFANNNDIAIHRSCDEPWKVTVVDTGLETMTGGRIKRVAKYIGNEPFMLTYGDAVCDVNLSELLKFHESHGKKATLTAVIQKQQKGVLDISTVGAVRNFREKQVVDQTPINAGYMVLAPSVLDLIEGDDESFEQGPLSKLADDGELMSYRHYGFWQCMDNLREKLILDELWKSGKTPWKIWD